MTESSNRERIRLAFAGLPPETRPSATRVAAIALIVTEVAGALEVLLIERATRDSDPWSGHMALPGGHAAPEDADLAATAERETLEEVGLDLARDGSRLGRLSDCTPVRGVPIFVRPYVYWVESPPPLTLSHEVERALWVAIAPLQAGQMRSKVTFSRDGQHLEFPAWDVFGHTVWGLTYRVLDEFFGRLSEVFEAESASLDNAEQPR